MTRSFFNILIIGLLSLACSNDGLFNPAAMKSDGFQGITYTNWMGDVVGPIDPSDWQLYLGHSQFLYLSKLYSTEKSIMVPTHVQLAPAYPNPFYDSISIEIALPVATDLRLVIIDENSNILSKRSGYYVAGIATFTWNGYDDQGRKFPDGLYRVVYDIAYDSNWIYTGFGDIWLRSKPL